MTPASVRASGAQPGQPASGSIVLRLAAWIAALALVALPLVGLLQGWFASERWPFRQLQVDAPFERVSIDQVRAAAAPHLEVGFFAVDLGAIQAEVERLPWVARAEVRKRWPDLLSIRLAEREAVALWGEQRLVAADGTLFEVPGHTVPAGLPALQGPDARATDALAFLNAADAALSGTGLRVAALAVSGRGSWSLLLSNGSRVVLGRDAPLPRFERFIDAWFAAPAPGGSRLLRADLRYSNGFAVEWAPSAPLPGAPTATPAPDGAPTHPPQA